MPPKQGFLSPAIGLVKFNKFSFRDYNHLTKITLKLSKTKTNYQKRNLK